MLRRICVPDSHEISDGIPVQFRAQCFQFVLAQSVAREGDLSSSTVTKAAARIFFWLCSKNEFGEDDAKIAPTVWTTEAFG